MKRLLRWFRGLFTLPAATGLCDECGVNEAAVRVARDFCVCRACFQELNAW